MTNQQYWLELNLIWTMFFDGLITNRQREQLRAELWAKYFGK